MPTYSYHCEVCGSDFDEIRKIARRETAECNCGRIASQTLSLSSLTIHCILEPTYDESLGQMIKSPKHRQEVMRSKGFEEL